MFDEFIYEMIRLVPFAIIFPIFIIGIFLMFKKNLKKEINKNNIKFAIYGTKDNISKAIGKDNKVVIAIKDKNLSNGRRKIPCFK